MIEAERRYESGQSMKDISIWLCCAKNTIRSNFISRGVPFNLARSQSTKSMGRPGARKGAILTDKQKSAISKANTGNKFCLGRVLSKESKEKMSRSRKIYLKNNPDGMKKALAALAAYSLAKKLPEKELIARQKVRAVMKQMLHRVLKMARMKKSCTIEKSLGYSKKELRDHIESQFTGDMSWQNRSSFHIDHIVPIAKFMDHGIHDPSIINNLKNLQVLPPSVNHRKSGKYDDDGYQGELFRQLTAKGWA